MGLSKSLFVLEAIAVLLFVGQCTETAQLRLEIFAMNRWNPYFLWKKKLQWHSAASILNPAQATVRFVATAWNTTFSVSCQTLFLEKFCQDCVELALLQHTFTMFLALQITTHSQCHVCTRLFRYDNNESAGKSDWGERKGKKTRGTLIRLCQRSW